MFGFPKGNLPSQWVGITALYEMQRIINEREDVIDSEFYMDDYLILLPTKKSCIECLKFIENYLSGHQVGVMSHPKKTAYAPIKRGFNFCGWHFTLRDDGTVQMKLRQDKKKLKKEDLKRKQNAYEKGDLSWENITNSMQSTFAHYNHGDTKGLQRYMCNRYKFQRNNQNNHGGKKR